MHFVVEVVSEYLENIVEHWTAIQTALFLV